MKYGDEVTGGYFKESLTKKLKSSIKKEGIRKCVSKIWLEHMDDDNEDYIFIYFKKGQTTVQNAYGFNFIECTQVPNMFSDPVKNMNDWLDEIAYVIEGTNI